jgi:hypothetical protein
MKQFTFVEGATNFGASLGISDERQDEIFNEIDNSGNEHFGIDLAMVINDKGYTDEEILFAVFSIGSKVGRGSVNPLEKLLQGLGRED